MNIEDKITFGLAIVFGVAWLGTAVVVIVTAVHFIRKFW